jgi:4,5-DOPA dioxygenase extradiol
MLPTVFVSHGSPMHAMDAGRAGDVWAQLGRTLPRPSAVLIASAHWETELTMLSTARQPETIHDFGGFPPELYKIGYPAPGAPTVAEHAIRLLQSSGLSATANACRGLDHGAWVPLRRMFPNADVPVVQVSIQPSLDAAHHLRVGTALAPLTRDGVLIIGSGHITHNLRDWMASVRQRGSRAVADGAADPYVIEFREWIADALVLNDRARLVRWRELAPHAARAHPTPEHFMPLFVAFGAASEADGLPPRVERLDAGVDSGVLAMDAYVFSPRPRDLNHS